MRIDYFLKLAKSTKSFRTPFPKSEMPSWTFTALFPKSEMPSWTFTALFGKFRISSEYWQNPLTNGAFDWQLRDDTILLYRNNLGLRKIIHCGLRILNCGLMNFNPKFWQSEIRNLKTRFGNQTTFGIKRRKDAASWRVMTHFGEGKERAETKKLSTFAYETKNRF